MSFSKNKVLDDYTLISTHDPAIDKDLSDLEMYENNYAYDAGKLSFLAGEQPTIFCCKQLSHRLVARLLDLMMRGKSGGEVELSLHEAALLAFRHGVSDILNLPGFDKYRHIQAGNPPTIKESWLDRSALPMDVIIEIGSVILSNSRLSEDDKKN